MFCEYCGKEIDDSAEYCEFCGMSTDENELPEKNPPQVGRGRILFVLEMLLNVAVAVSPFVKLFDITVIKRFSFSLVDAIDTVNGVLDAAQTLGINIKFPKTGNFGFWLAVVLIGAAAAIAAGYVFLILSIISLGKRQKFSSSCKKSAVSLVCFLASFALTYLAVFLLNSMITDKIYFDLSLFGVNILFYIFVAGAAAGIILSWFCKRREKA